MTLDAYVVPGTSPELLPDAPVIEVHTDEVVADVPTVYMEAKQKKTDAHCGTASSAPP